MKFKLIELEGMIKNLIVWKHVAKMSYTDAEKCYYGDYFKPYITTIKDLKNTTEGFKDIL